MANIDRPGGFFPVAKLDGSKIPTKDFLVNGLAAVRGFVGDAVSVDAAGGVEISAANDGVLIVGVIEAIYDTNHVPIGAPGSLITNKYLTLGDDAIVTVALAMPDAVFRIQANGATVAADVWQHAQLVATVGAAVTSRSAHELNTGSQGAAIAELMIIGKVDEPGNDWGQDVDLLVTFAESVWCGDQTAVGA